MKWRKSKAHEEVGYWSYTPRALGKKYRNNFCKSAQIYCGKKERVEIKNSKGIYKALRVNTQTQ